MCCIDTQTQRRQFVISCLLKVNEQLSRQRLRALGP